MVDLATRRSEFKVYLVDRDPSAARFTIDSLQAAGFTDIQYLPSVDSALVTIKQTMPHIVVFDYAGFESVAEPFLREVTALSAEILVILITTAAQGIQGFQVVARKLAYDVLMKPVGSHLELLQKLDRAADRLYFQFESEQLREHYQAHQAAGVAAHPSAAEVIAPPASPMARQVVPLDASAEMMRPGYIDINDMLEKLGPEQDIEETIVIFMAALTRALYDVPVLYFKYFPTHLTLLFSRATLLPNEKFRGIGVDLRKEELQKIPQFFADPRRIVELRTLVREVFKRETFSAFTHFDDQEPRGVFVVLDDVEVQSSKSKVLALLRIFSLAYKRNVTIKEKHAFDITDSLTGLYNRKHFTQILVDEIARARRLLMPLTLLVIDIDRTQLLNERLGFQQVDTILRIVAQILKKSTRTNDILARTGSDEFACLLPHTPHMGGAIKAERLRRIIEATKFPMLEGAPPLTISCGISEYPSFGNDADQVFHLADEALLEVKKAGGNRVSLAKVSAGYVKDFEPVDVPMSPRVGGSK